MQTNNVNPPPWYQTLSAECQQALAKVLASWETRTGLQLNATYNFLWLNDFCLFDFADSDIFNGLEEEEFYPVPSQE